MKSLCQIIAALFAGAVLWSAPSGYAQTTAPEWAVPPAAESSHPIAVPTFESVGLYWSPADGAAENPCAVRYRKSGEETWHDAMALWFDERNKEYRGSIVYLTAGAEYEILLQLGKTGSSQKLMVTTWSNTFPVARTVTLPAGMIKQAYAITEAGTASGYVLYEGNPAGTVIDVDDQQDTCMTVSASYVIVRGVALKGAKRHGMIVHGAVHDVVVERCDISGWGRVASDGWGANLDAGIRVDSPAMTRLIVQGNKIHHPRSNSNDWTQERSITKEHFSGHPQGPQGIVMVNSAGNHVIRYNEIYSDESHRFNDGLGGNDNFSLAGYPGPDSDIYGNRIENVCDDAIEAEGGGRNVRIWNNYMSYTFTGVASASCSVGPLYIFRNIMGVARLHDDNSDDPYNHGVFGKISDTKGSDGKTYGRGRRYFLHNTLLQPKLDGRKRTAGAGWGAGDLAGGMTNTVSRNNMWDVAPNCVFGAIRRQGSGLTSWSVSDQKRGSTNDFDYDFCNGAVILAAGQEAHGMTSLPIYAPSNGPGDGAGGHYALAPESPGYDRGVRIANFNDDFKGAAPDVGAHEAGAPAMSFGVEAFIRMMPPK